MATVTTEYSPDELCKRVIWALDVVHQDILGHDKAPSLSRAGMNHKTLEDLEKATNLVRKLEDSFIRSIYKDATRIQQEAQKNPAIAKQAEQIMDRIKGILVDVSKEEYRDIRKGNFLRRLAHHLSGKVKKGAKQIIKFEEELKKKAEKEREKIVKGKIAKGNKRLVA